MNTLLQNQILGAISTLRGVAGVAVDYVRATGVTVAGLTAIPSRTDFFTLTPYGDQVRSQSVDWVFASSDLDDAGTRFVPERGDRIVVDLADEDKRLSFEVASPQGDDLFRYTDPHRAGVRVFTNHTKTEAIPG